MDKIFANSFSKELKRIRLRQSCSQIEFCNRLGIPSGTYSAWETGRFLPSVKSLTELCEQLHYIKVPDFDIRTLKCTYYDLKVGRNEHRQNDKSS